MQYPWRLLTVLFPTVAFIAGSVIESLSKKWAVVLVVLSIALTWSYQKPVLYEPRGDEYYLTRREFTDGTSSMGNSFSTIWTGWKNERVNEKVTVLQGQVQISDLKTTPLETNFTVSSDSPSRIRIHTLYYPGWIVTIDGTQVPIDYQTDGVIDFSVPQGTDKVNVEFRETPLRRATDTISLIGLLYLVSWAILRVRYAHSS